jgi:multidrug efflux pump subunit AcrA (membrane-fusion protein)
MSDRVIVSLAVVPMIAGAVLLVAFQRAPALHASAPKQAPHSGVLSASESRASTKWVGVIAAGNTAELAAEHDGRVTEVFLEAGTRVKPDQAILQIDSSDATSALGMASAELGQRSSEAARAAARVEEARSKLSRLKAGGNWIADHEIEQAAAAVRMAEAEYRAAVAGAQVGRAKLSMQKNHEARHRLRAPFAGVLVDCTVDPGDSSMVTKIRTEKPEIDTSAQLVFATATLELTDAQRNVWLPGTRVEVAPAQQAPVIMHDERATPNSTAVEPRKAEPTRAGK